MHHSWAQVGHLLTILSPWKTGLLAWTVRSPPRSANMDLVASLLEWSLGVSGVKGLKERENRSFQVNVTFQWPASQPHGWILSSAAKYLNPFINCSYSYTPNIPLSVLLTRDWRVLWSGGIGDAGRRSHRQLHHICFPGNFGDISPMCLAWDTCLFQGGAVCSSCRIRLGGHAVTSIQGLPFSVTLKLVTLMLGSLFLRLPLQANISGGKFRYTGKYTNISALHQILPF